MLGREPLLIGDLILAEALQGLASDRDFEQARTLLGALDVLPVGGATIAIQAARHFRILRGHGIPVRKTIDTLIATRCIEHDHALLYSDRDFEPFVRHLGLRSALAEYAASGR